MNANKCVPQNVVIPCGKDIHMPSIGKCRTTYNRRGYLDKPLLTTQAASAFEEKQGRQNEIERQITFLPNLGEDIQTCQ